MENGALSSMAFLTSASEMFFVGAEFSTTAPDGAWHSSRIPAAPQLPVSLE
jgi:hypothetical protein